MVASQWKKKSKPSKATAAGYENGTAFRPTGNNLMDAIDSLYVDQLKPVGRIILRRLGELAAESSADGAVPHIDPKVVRRLCEGHPQLRVQAEVGDDYTAIVVDRVANFVDASSSDDPYPEELWTEATEYFCKLVGEDAQLPGGRYACAKLLACRDLPFLAGRCLGEICHIIALATTRRKLLGYLNGYMVAHDVSETGMREQCAASHQPASSLKKDRQQFPVADWDQARACLLSILEAFGGTVQLANVKRLFHSKFQLELSETFLGHTRLNELLQDSRFQDICAVTPQSSGSYLVVQNYSGAVFGLQARCDVGASLGEETSCLSTTPLPARKGFPLSTPTVALATPTQISPWASSDDRSGSLITPPPGLEPADADVSSVWQSTYLHPKCLFPAIPPIPPLGMPNYLADADSSTATEAASLEAWSTASSCLDVPSPAEWNEYSEERFDLDAVAFASMCMGNDWGVPTAADGLGMYGYQSHAMSFDSHFFQPQEAC